MKWVRICNTAWECKPFRIAAADIGGKVYRYTLFKNLVQIETFDSPEAAKRRAYALQ